MCEIYHEIRQFKMVLAFSPTFVADTKIIFGYNFVAPLKAFGEFIEQYKFRYIAQYPVPPKNAIAKS